jgi:hypothetical protein
VFERAHWQKHPNSNGDDSTPSKEIEPRISNSVYPTPLIEETGKDLLRFGFPYQNLIRVNSWLAKQNARRSVNGTGLTPGYEGSIRKLWEKTLIQKREQAIAC